LLQNLLVLIKPCSIKNFLLLVVAISLVTNCETNSHYSSRLLDFAPRDASVIFTSESYENLSTAINNNQLLNEAFSYKKLSALKTQLKILNRLKIEGKFLVCLSTTKNDSLYYTIVTRAEKGFSVLDSIKNATFESVNSKNGVLKKISIEGQSLYSKIIDSVFVGSNSLSILEGIGTDHNVDAELENISANYDKEASLSVIMNLKNSKIKPSFFMDSLLNQKQFSNYMRLDFDISQDNLVGNGVTKATDSTESLINVFKNTTPKENNFGKIAPSGCDYVLSYTFNNFNNLNENLLKLKKTDSVIQTNVFDNIIEVSLIKEANQQALVLYSIDDSITQEALDSQDEIDNFRDVPVFAFDKPEFFRQTLSPLIHFDNASNYTLIAGFFVFSDSIDFLKSIIANHQNNNTLSENSGFKNMMTELSNVSSIFVYNNPTSLNTTLNTNFGENLNLKVDSYKTSALQFIYDTNFAHVNSVFKTSRSKGESNEVSEDLEIKLGAEILSKPQIVSNHTNNQKDIVVQDVNNNLYLISNQGKIYWKKQLEGRILGNIEQMDIYKNGRLQLVFATPHRVYILDRNGNDVKNFPLKFNDEITQPLSLFDYDRNKNYRLLVTQGGSLLMYDRLGDLVKGFNFKKGNDAISSQPKHFRIGKKDYIVFSQGKTLQVLGRTGKSRINVKETIDFSGNSIYVYNDNFTTTTNKGYLVQVSQNGSVNYSNLNLSGEHFITATSRTLVTLSENHLTIKSNSIDLDYGEYTAPEIFYINDKIYVTTTDLQSKKVYLFDSLGKPIANFPIYGNSAIAMENIDRDPNLEIVGKGDDDSIIVYEIN